MSDNKRAKNLETLCILAAAAVALGLLFGYKWPLWLALALLAAGVISEKISGKISAAWLAFTKIVGRLNSRVVLSLVFYLVLTPIAFLYRFFSINPLRLAKLQGDGSYFHDRKHTYSKRDLENTW